MVREFDLGLVKGDPFRYEDFTPEQLAGLVGPQGSPGASGAPGQDGQDGVSPAITGNKVGKVTTLTIVDAAHPGGTTLATINDGADGAAGQPGTDGQDGVSPVITGNKVGKVTTLTIVDKDHPEGATLATINDGADGGGGGGDMYKATYDADNDGVVDDAAALSGHAAAYFATAAALTSHTGNTDIHVTLTDKVTWDGKQAAISDLSDIRSGAALGATALQEVPDTYRTAAAQDALDSGKQDVITDLSTIRSGAALGATAVQPETGKGLFSGSYADLTDQPTIPAAVTESTVAGWGFTKNTGTYSKPASGIPSTDMTETVQSSLAKADSALQEHQSLSGYVQTNDSRLSDSRTPLAHAASHMSGGTDVLTPADIGAAPASHAQATNNPHGVTKAQVGLDNVANVLQYSASNPPPADSSKQDKITASGILKGNGSGTVSAAVSGTDYLAPSSKGAANGVASLDANSKVTAEQAAARIVSISANTTLSSTHYGCLLLVTGTRTITIASGLTVGAEVEIMNYGTGAVTVKANSGVTLNGVSAGSKAISSQYTGAVLKCVASNAWVIQGAIT